VLGDVWYSLFFPDLPILGLLSFHALKMGVNFDRFGRLTPCFAGVEKPMDKVSRTPSGQEQDKRTDEQLYHTQSLMI